MTQTGRASGVMRKREYARMTEEVSRVHALAVRFLAGTDITIPFTYPGFRDGGL